jgi:hypothetical protein
MDGERWPNRRDIPWSIGLFRAVMPHSYAVLGFTSTSSTLTEETTMYANTVPRLLQPRFYSN